VGSGAAPGSREAHHFATASSSFVPVSTVAYASQPQELAFKINNGAIQQEVRDVIHHDQKVQRVFTSLPTPGVGLQDNKRIKKREWEREKEREKGVSKVLHLRKNMNRRAPVSHGYQLHLVHKLEKNARKFSRWHGEREI
jgi:hypothetical protein